jgi:hypothetical protein
MNSVMIGTHHVRVMRVRNVMRDMDAAKCAIVHVASGTRARTLAPS